MHLTKIEPYLFTCKNVKVFKSTIEITQILRQTLNLLTLSC